MKKALLFFGGFLAGVVATILVAVVINAANQPNDGLYGLTLFEEKGDAIAVEKNTIEVFQVIAPNAALARTGDFIDGILVLLINYDGKSYYDDQKIKIPSNQSLIQIGTYRYTARNEMVKTVPAVIIE